MHLTPDTCRDSGGGVPPAEAFKLMALEWNRMHVYPTTAPDPTGALCIPGPLHLKTSAHLHAYEVFIHSVQSTGLQQLPRLQQEDDSTLVTKTAKLLQPPPPPPPPPQQQQQQPPLPPRGRY